MAKQRSESENWPSAIIDQRNRLASHEFPESISMPPGTIVPLAKEGSPADLAFQRNRLASQIAEIDEKLTAGKEPEFKRITADVESANSIFGTSWALVDQSAPVPVSMRKCSACHEAGHNKTNCPTTKAATA